MGMLVISFFETTSSNLRKYDVVHSQTQRQDNWQVETRRRKSGKMAGSLYKVWTMGTMPPVTEGAEATGKVAGNGRRRPRKLMDIVF